MSKYPDLDLGAMSKLKLLKEQFEADPEFLTSAACPYAAEVKALITDLFEVRVETIVLKEGEKVEGYKKRGRKAKNALSDEQVREVEEQAMELLKELKDLRPPTGAKFDTETKIQIIKAKTALIDKVVAIQERAYNVRKVAHFQTTVIQVLTDLVSEDDRAEFQKRLEPYL